MKHPTCSTCVALCTCALVLLCVGAFASPPSSQPATQPDADALEQRLREIDRRAAEINDLSAEFVQLKHTALLKQPMRSEGTVRIKGQAMRWDTTEPHETVMTLDQRELRMYYPRQKTIEVYPLAERMGEFAASPLPRLKSLREHFDLRRFQWDNLPATKAENLLGLELIPRTETMREHVERVRVLIDVERGCVMAAEVVDPDGDRLELTFDRIRINEGLSEDDVALKVPPGTTIVHPLEGAPGSKEPAP